MAITDITVKFSLTDFTIHQKNAICYAVFLDLRMLANSARHLPGITYEQFKRKLIKYPIKSVSVVNSTNHFSRTDVRKYIKAGMKGAGLEKIAHEKDIIEYYRDSDNVYVRTDMPAHTFSGLDIYAVNAWIRKLWEAAGEVKTALDVLNMGDLKNKYEVAYVLSLNFSKQYDAWRRKDYYVEQQHGTSHCFAPSADVLNADHIDVLLHWYKHPEYRKRGPYKDDIRCTGWHDLFCTSYASRVIYNTGEFKELAGKVDTLISQVKKGYKNV